jgi:hypothetical protein
VVYLTSLAATATPAEFAAAALPIIRRDSLNSSAAKVYASAMSVASKEQQAHLQAELRRTGDAG